MEMELMSPVNYVPSFARGQNVLLIHNNESSLNYLSSLLNQFSFNVTTLANASTAAYMIGRYEDWFNIVMAKMDMLGSNVISFMQLLNQKNIQLIFICSEGSVNAATWEWLAEGPCYLLEEPILEKDLKYLWHNIYQTKSGSGTKTDDNEAHEANGEENGDDSGSLDNNDHIAEEGEARKADRNGSAKKKRHAPLWTPELHQLFEKTVLMLGNEDAQPKDVLIYMNVPSITKDQVKSHLQKYNAQLKLKKAESSIFEGPSYQEGFAPSHPAPNTSLNMNKEQNQNQMSSANAAQTQQESHTSKQLEIQGNTYKFPLVFNSHNQCIDAQTVIPTRLANNDSQSLDSTLGKLVSGASTVETQLKPMFSPTQRYKSQLKLKKAQSSYLSSGSSRPYFTTKNKYQEQNKNQMSSSNPAQTQQESNTRKQLENQGKTSRNMPSMLEGPSYQGFAPCHPAPTTSLNMNQERNQNQMSSADAAQTQQKSNTGKQLEIQGNPSKPIPYVFEGPSYQGGFAPSHHAPTTSLNMNKQQNQNHMSYAGPAKTQQKLDASKQLEIQCNTSKNMSSMFGGPSYQGFSPSHPAPTTSLNMNQEPNQNQMSFADAAQTQQKSDTSKQLEIPSKNMSSMIEGPSYQAGFAPSHPTPISSLNMNQEQNQNQMSSTDAAQTQQESDTRKQLEIQGNTSTNMPYMFGAPSYQGGFTPSHPAPITSLNMNQEENQNQMSSADATQTQQESDTSKPLEIQGNTSIVHEFPTGLANNESQSLDSILGNLVPEASTVETQPEEDFDSILQKMREDKFFADEMNMGYDYEFNAALRMMP